MNRLLLAALALSGCDFFSNVVVPGTDRTAPLAIASVYSLAEARHVATTSNTGTPLTYELTDMNETIVPIAAAFDHGGARRVTMQGEIATTCVDGDLGVTLHQLLAPQVVTQSGGVGSTVSNGIYTVDPVRGRDLIRACPDGYTPEYGQFTWSVQAEDFHGNVSTHGRARVVFEP